MIAEKKRITKESFQKFLEGQDRYKLYPSNDYEELAQEQNIALANFRRKKLSQTGIRGNNGNIKYLTFDEASYLAKVSRSMINKWANKGKFSVAYKLKLNGGDIKAVQGDSGHAQVNMVTDVYSYILDDDRRKNAELFEEAFYEKKNLDPQMHA